jgi:hypothetical protein
MKRRTRPGALAAGSLEKKEEDDSDRPKRRQPDQENANRPPEPAGNADQDPRKSEHSNEIEKAQVRHEDASLPAGAAPPSDHGPTMRIVQKSEDKPDWMRYAYGIVK